MRTRKATITVQVEDGFFDKMRVASPMYTDMSDDDIFVDITGDFFDLNDSWSDADFTVHVGDFVDAVEEKPHKSYSAAEDDADFWYDAYQEVRIDRDRFRDGVDAIVHSRVELYVAKSVDAALTELMRQTGPLDPQVVKEARNAGITTTMTAHLYEKLRSHRVRLADLEKAARLRIEKGCSDTCSHVLSPECECDCGHEALCAALQEDQT